MAQQCIVGLDIGTASVKAVVAERQGRRLVPRLFLKEEAGGMRRGAIVDLGEITSPVARVFSEIRKVYRHMPKEVYASIGTAHARTQQSRGIIAVSRADSEIYQDDIERAVKASQAINLPLNRMIIHNVVREFIVDGVPDIVDPLGLSGSRLEVNSLIVDAFSPHIKSLMRVVEMANGQIAGLVFSPLAASKAALTKAQKDLGVVLIDIGAGTTGMAIWEENKLVAVAKFPVGASHLSNDLAIGLKVPVTIAESLKLNYGFAISKDVGSKETVEMSKFMPDARGAVARRFISEIIEARLSEIFEFVNNEIKSHGKFGQLAGGAVIVGGGSKLPGLTELAKQELRLSAQIGMATDGDWHMETLTHTGYMEDPEFMTALGLVLWGTHQDAGSVSESMGAGAKKLGNWVKSALKPFMP